MVAIYRQVIRRLPAGTHTIALTTERDSDKKRINYNQSRAVAKSDGDCEPVAPGN